VRFTSFHQPGPRTCPSPPVTAHTGQPGPSNPVSSAAAAISPPCTAKVCAGVNEASPILITPFRRWTDRKPIPYDTTVKLGLGVKVGLGALLLLGVAACSATDPTPSPLFDGYYTGTRRSDRLDACGVTQTEGKTTARVTDGRIAIPLFTAKTQLSGTVGEDGTVRASGIWPNPTGGYPGVTVLNGTVRDKVLDGTASDFRCHTDIHLEKIAPAQGGAGGRSTTGKPRHYPGPH
jgi:hypothetical protein